MFAIVAALTGATEAVAARDFGSATTAVVADLREHHATLFGVATGGGRDTSSGLARVAGAAGKAPGLVNVYRSFADPFAAAPVPEIAATGALPMVTWEPWDPAGGTHQPKFALRLVAGGRYDAYARAWAVAAREYGRPLLLRFAPEMNGNWTPWSAGVNGNNASDYVHAWRHLHNLFRSVGASNVSWVWSPNIVFRGSTPLTNLYPGDAYVDWIGIDGYNWGTSRPGRSWVGFDRLFGPTLQQVRRLARKPLMLSEVASTEQGGDKAAWIGDFFRALDRNRDVLAFVWFDVEKETDWRISSSASARSAFARGVAAARYRGADAVAG